MALDIAILGSNGVPIRQIPLLDAEHHIIMQTASRHGLSYILRMNDYYADCDFLPHELPQLKNELVIVAAMLAEEAVKSKISALIGLFDEATQCSAGLSAIAD